MATEKNPSEDAFKEDKPSIVDYINLSKIAWSTLGKPGAGEQFPGIQWVQMACAQRSAQALENIATTSLAIINDYNSVKEQLYLANEKIKKLEHDNAVLHKHVAIKNKKRVRLLLTQKY